MDKGKINGSLGVLLKYAGDHKKLTITGCIFSGFSSALSVVPYICIYFLLKGLFHSWHNLGAASDLNFYGWTAVIVSAGGIVIYFLGLLCTHSAAFRVSKNMKKAALEHIAELPMGFFDRQTSGRLRKIIDENTELTETFLAHQLPDMVGALVLPVAVLILLFIFDWRLGLLCLLPMVISFIFQSRMFVGKNAGFMKTYLDTLEEMNAQAVEYVRGVPVVKVFQQTVFSFKNFYHAIMKYKDFASGYSLNCRVPMVGYTIASNGAAFVLIPAAILLLKNTADPVQFLLDFMFYILFSPLCASIMGRIRYVAEASMQAGQAAERLDMVLKEPVLKEPEVSRKPENTSVSYVDVSFTYTGTAGPAVDHVSFSIPAGNTVALVGTSGGGKTTAASLLPRFFDADGGKVCIGSVDVRDIKTQELMNYVAFVFQDTHLFKASVRENIRLGRPTAAEKEIITALHMAQCDDIIAKLPNGIDTVIGEKGIYLSGGEQQRLALARAILKDAPIIVLDEATAFADSENEAAIQKAFAQLTHNKTVLMIAHRLSTVKNADRIHVMEDGRLVESGTHQELVKLGKIYAKMWNDYQSSIRWKLGKEA